MMMTFAIATGETYRLASGNPTLDSLDGETRAPLQTILHESWTAEDRAAFGVYSVDTTPPDGQRWTGAFADSDGLPAAVFEIIPPPGLDDYRRAIQAHIDATARSRDYGDGVACASYVASAVPQWQAEALAFVQWRDAVWLHAYQGLAAHDPSEPPPAIADVVAGLPAMEWPA
jgi:hypothetical protein